MSLRSVLMETLRTPTKLQSWYTRIWWDTLTANLNRILGLKVDKDFIKDDNMIAYFRNRLKRRVIE